MRVAKVHYWFVTRRGDERAAVLGVLLFPSACAFSARFSFRRMAEQTRSVYHQL